MIEDASSSACLHHFSIAQAKRRDPPQVFGIRLEWPTSDKEGRIRRIVRNGVDDSPPAFGLWIDTMSPSRSYSAGIGFALTDVAQGIELA
jgi:hypothetical protein